jgi:hypothetical protein
MNPHTERSNTMSATARYEIAVPVFETRQVGEKTVGVSLRWSNTGNRTPCVALASGDRCIDGERPDYVEVFTDDGGWVCPYCAEMLVPDLHAKRRQIDKEFRLAYAESSNSGRRCPPSDALEAIGVRHGLWERWEPRPAPHQFPHLEEQHDDVRRTE